MRDDMYKVIVERPRLRHGAKPAWFREGRKFRNRVWLEEDGVYGLLRAGMKRGYFRRKWLNENLAPLYRWLDKQAGRPWDDVYADLARNIDRRNTVQAHIFTHVEDRVETHTMLVRGEVYAETWRGHRPIGESHARLFVRPATRILERNLARERHERERKARAKREAEAKLKDLRVIGPLEQLRRIDGIWYQVSLAPLPADARPVWDVVAREQVARKGRHGPDLYAWRKRQLGKKELRHHKLHLEAGNSRPLFFPVVARPGLAAGRRFGEDGYPLRRRPPMCRWLAYSGSPIALEEVLFKPASSLVVQSKKSREGVETTNGDGFGVGWYGRDGQPRLFRSTNPMWNDRNLRELSADIQSGLFLAHVRSSTGTAVQQTNCHPFRHGRWLWMHNGLINGFEKIRRDLLLAVDPSLFACIEGTTDSELMFHLALTMGLESDPQGAVARMTGFVEATGRRRGIEHPMQMSLAASDGRDLWVFRYSSERRSRSLYYSTDVKTLRKLYPDAERFKAVSEETRLVVSEPFVDLPGAWNAVPEGTCGVVRKGEDEFRPFEPVESERVAVPA